ncbi:MAG TPA: flagellar hook-basal body complex protein FliE [Defluviitaleaceae bacterium]|jgi:flagellar hook-basal body complex protein FliE|nr:flagellar hook-basal body complex protein FliE [Candidatus Epulonipiscium sp.]HOA80688.1 flagellar hook-basal body complex protein FliE [Defluviitaleaceae bacterium]
MKIESRNFTNSLDSHYDSNVKVNRESIAFEDFYKAAIGLIEQTNSLQKEAEQISLDFIIGRTDNIHNVMIAQEKANIALQFTVQITNKVLEAYNEIMRINL